MRFQNVSVSHPFPHTSRASVSKIRADVELTMSKLTKRAVDALMPPEKGQTFLWDSELRGFGVRAIPSGLKTFIFQYRNAEGRSRRIVVGRYGVLTVEQARDKVKIKLGAVAGGA